MRAGPEYAEPLMVFESEAPVATSRAEGLSGYLDKQFMIQERGSTVMTELRAGLVTWVTMSYIVVVNPMIISAASAGTQSPISFTTAVWATCISAGVATGFVGLFANLPFGLAAGMGLNSYFRYNMMGTLGMSAGAALACCFVQAAIFAVLAMSRTVDRMQDVVPDSLKSAITVAIGVFQAFVGLQVMGVVVRSDATLVTLGDTSKPEFWLSVTATVLVTALLIRKVKGALLLGITYTAVAMHFLGIAKGMTSAIDEPGSLEVAAASAVVAPESELVGLDFGGGFSDVRTFATALVSILFVVVFDTAGVQHGLGQQAGLLDDSGRLPGAKLAYMASAVGTAVGALLGTSPVIIHNESTAGVHEGGRTGLCAVTVSLLFFVSPALVSVIELVPPEATAPCLVLVGAMMMTPVRGIDFGDLRIALPAFLIITVTPLTFSISAGISSGIAAYFVIGFVLMFADAAVAGGSAAAEFLTQSTGRARMPFEKEMI